MVKEKIEFKVIGSAVAVERCHKNGIEVHFYLHDEILAASVMCFIAMATKIDDFSFLTLLWILLLEST